jgi:hypothetical protein
MTKERYRCRWGRNKVLDHAAGQAAIAAVDLAIIRILAPSFI